MIFPLPQSSLRRAQIRAYQVLRAEGEPSRHHLDQVVMRALEAYEEDRPKVLSNTQYRRIVAALRTIANYVGITEEEFNKKYPDTTPLVELGGCGAVASRALDCLTEER